MENLKNLEKIAKIFQPQNIITSEEIDQVLKGIMDILASYKKGTDAINEETKAVVNILLDKVIQSNKQTLDKAETVLDTRVSELETLLKDMKSMIEDVEAIASDVKDGKDADEEKIVEDVISRIKIDPTVITVSAQEVRDKLASLKDEERLDKSAIKGLDKILTQKDIDYAVATLQQQTSFLINKGGVKSIVAGTNITVDNTDPSNPVISASGGGSGTPGGSDTQLQYNNAGSFGGISGATTNGTAVTFTSNSLIGADINASSSAGFVIHNNTGTDVALFGAGSGTGATFYGGVNIASNLTVDTDTLFVDATNNVVGIGTSSPLTQTGNKLQVGDNSAAHQYLVFQTNNSFERGIQYYLTDGTTLRGFMKWDGNEDLLLKGDVTFISTSGVSNAFTFMDGGGIGLMGIGTTSPTHSLTLNSTSTGIAIYKTADQTTNYERLNINWSSNVVRVQEERGGSGTGRILRLAQQGTGSNFVQIDLQHNSSTNAIFITPNTYSGTSIINLGGTLNASSSTQSAFLIAPTINQSGTAGYTALLVNPTETATGSGTKLLADFQVGGSSKFKITNGGEVTLTGRINKRVVTTTDDSTAVIDVAVTDVYQLTAIANNTTFSFTGTPTDGQNFVIRYKDAGVSKTLTWTGFTAIGVTLPTATTAGKWGYVGVTYNAAASAYHVTAVTTEA